MTDFAIWNLHSPARRYRCDGEDEHFTMRGAGWYRIGKPQFIAETFEEAEAERHRRLANLPAPRHTSPAPPEPTDTPT